MTFRIPRHFFAVVAAIIWMLSLFAPVYAAMMPLDTFWVALDQTDRLLTSQNEATSQQVKTIWQNIDTVLLTDGTQMHIDMSWVISGTSNPSATAVWSLTRRRIERLLSFNNAEKLQQHDPAYAARLLAALKEVLQDPRFQYSQPVPNNPAPQADYGAAIAPVVQVILIVVVVAAIVTLLFVAVRGLLVRRRILTIPTSIEADPETSVDAQARAGKSEVARDYREAIRYLYLGSLLLLDERGLIHYEKSLTNREHLRQVANKPILTDALQPVVNTFERVWYGFAPVDEDLYREFRENVERLQKLTP